MSLSRALRFSLRVSLLSRASCLAISACWILLGVFCAGCGGDGLILIPVEGTVSFQNQPLTTGSVALVPDLAKGNKSLHHPTGVIDAQGAYKIFTSGRAGAPAGHYRVIVHATESTDDPRLAHPGMPRSLIPTKYSQAKLTPLELEVREEMSPDSLNLRLVP